MEFVAAQPNGSISSLMSMHAMLKSMGNELDKLKAYIESNDKEMKILIARLQQGGLTADEALHWASRLAG